MLLCHALSPAIKQAGQETGCKAPEHLLMLAWFPGKRLANTNMHPARQQASSAPLQSLHLDQVGFFLSNRKCEVRC